MTAVKTKENSKWSLEQLLELQEALAKYEGVKSQNDLAKMLDVNAGTLSSVKNSNWVALSDSMIAKLRALLDLDDWQIRQSRNLKVTHQLCNDAQSNKRFLALAAYTGAGKTVGLKTYCRTNPNCYYVLASTLMTRKGFIDAIMRSMSIREDGNAEAKMGYIVNKLRKTVDPLLVIDDAGKLNDNCLQVLQIIYDETENNAGIIIAGVDLLKKRIDKNAAKDKMSFRELKRRIAYWQPLVRPEADFMVRVCKDYGIEDTKAVQYILRNVNDYGTLKNLITNVVKARKVTEDAVVSVQFLLDLHLGDEHYKTMG